MEKPKCRDKHVIGGKKERTCIKCKPYNEYINNLMNKPLVEHSIKTGLCFWKACPFAPNKRQEDE